MCTCCQNWTNSVSANSLTRSGCNSGNTRTGCGCTSCGGNTRMGCGCNNGCGSRYISFPISGTAVVPTSSIYFYPTSWGNSNGCFGTQTTNTSNGCFGTQTTSASSGCQTTSGCFGRCGGRAAIANYYEDYYARQYGLND